MKPITELGNTGIKVILLRRTGENTVKCAVGYRAANGLLSGWYAARPPTHFDSLPPYPGKSGAKP
jgi:hypothetical protein